MGKTPDLRCQNGFPNRLTIPEPPRRGFAFQSPPLAAQPSKNLDEKSTNRDIDLPDMDT
jgi:hypothetical protein